MSARPLAILAASVAVALAACRGPAVDPQGFEAAPRAATEFHWRGDRCALRARDVRLVVLARGAGSGSTEFVVDTGSSGTALSRGSALGREAIVSQEAGGNIRGTPSYQGVLPRMTIGGLAADDVPVLVWDQSHSLGAPGNLLGLSHLRDLVLCHRREDRTWWLANPREGPPWVDGLGSSVVDFAGPGLPVVAIEPPEGGTAFALIDTGSPVTALVDAGSATGDHVVRDREGRVVLTLDIRRRVRGLEGLRAGGKPIRALIGLDTLAARTWTLDLPRAQWRLAP